MEWVNKLRFMIELIWNVFVFCGDLSIDIYYSFKYYNSKQHSLFGVTFFFCILPSIVHFLVRKKTLHLDFLAE